MSEAEKTKFGLVSDLRLQSTECLVVGVPVFLKFYCNTHLYKYYSFLKNVYAYKHF